MEFNKLMFKKPKPLQNSADYEHAYQYALFLLNLRMRTVAEMKEKMYKRGYDSSVAEQVINNLLKEKYLDDENYFEVFMENMKTYKTWGKYLMKKKLIEKKLPQELINSRLNEIVNEDDEYKIAKRYLDKELRGVEKLSELDYNQKQKFQRRLLSRGFSTSVVVKLLS